MTDRLKIDSQNVLIQDGHSYADYIYNKQNVVRTGEDRYTLNNEHLRYTIKTDLKVPKSKQKRHLKPHCTLKPHFSDRLENV